MVQARLVLALASFALCSPAAALGQVPKSPPVCLAHSFPSPDSRAAFAEATITALTYGWSAVQEGDRFNQSAKEAGNPEGLMIAMMRHTKLSSESYACAEQTLLPYVKSKDRDGIALMAAFMVMAYRRHQELDKELLTMLREMEASQRAPSDMGDTISTLQVEHGKAWKDVLTAVAGVAHLLVDTTRTSPKGTLDALILTRAQHTALHGQLRAAFPLKKSPTQEDPYPVFAASMLAQMLTQPYRCADEK